MSVLLHDFCPLSKNIVTKILYENFILHFFMILAILAFQF